MRFIILVILCFIILEVKGQKEKFYVADNNRYSVLVDSKVVISTKEIGDGLIDYFVVNDSDDIFQYYFSVSMIEVEEKIDIYTDDYVEAFRKECQCDISSYNRIVYNNLEGYKIDIKANEQGQDLGGYSVSTTFGNNLYNITFLTRTSDLNAYNSNFKRFINSFVINRSF